MTVMATPAQFLVVIGHEAESIGADGSPANKIFEFQIPTDAQLSPAILQFMVHPSKNADELAVEFLINDKRVYWYGTSSETIVRMFQVVISGNRDFPIKRGANVLKVRKAQGNGAFGVSDFVVWFHQPASIAAVRRPRRVASSRRTAKPKRKSTRKRKSI